MVKLELANKYVEADVKEFLEKYEDTYGPAEMKFLIAFAGEIIKSYEHYHQLVNFKETTDSYGFET